MFLSTKVFFLRPYFRDHAESELAFCRDLKNPLTLKLGISFQTRPSNRGIDNAIKNSLLDSLIKSLGCSAEFVITCWKFAARSRTLSPRCIPVFSLFLSTFLSFSFPLISSRVSRRPRLHLLTSLRPCVSLFPLFPRGCRRQMPTSPSFSVTGNRITRYMTPRGSQSRIITNRTVCTRCI